MKQAARWFRLIPAPLWLLAVILLFFNRMAFSNLILARGDVFKYFYPYWHTAAEALRHGQIPLWNPHVFMGAPFLANSQIGFLYPFNWPFWLLFSTPYAVSASILFHLWIGSWGAYKAARRVMGLERGAALLAGGVFALGGYVSAQVEHINQLQGIAWMPWILLVVHQYIVVGRPSRSVAGRTVSSLAILFGLQLLAGHTQTTFITGVMVVFWVLGILLGEWFDRESAAGTRLLRRLTVALPVLGGGVLLALLLAGAQLLPTWELMQQSSRQTGLTVNEVLSFSLHPALLTRSLLPAWGQGLASEYIAFLPVTVWLLMLVGGWKWRRRPAILAALLLLGVGLFLALGAYNPANWLIARLPGFNLFRAPARWLLLTALAAALLAGAGWQEIWSRWRRSEQLLPGRGFWQPLTLLAILLAGLVFWNWGAVLLVRWLPTGEEAPFSPAGSRAVMLWLMELVCLFLILQPISFRSLRRLHPLLLLPLLLLMQFLGTRTHPYNQLTTPEAFFDLRAPAARLQALTIGDEPPGRFLSLSGILFDVGDQAEIDTIYADQLPPQGQYDYTVAMKMKEVIDANLPMVYDLSSVDGFDGGILPLQRYTQFSELLLGPGQRTTDGRLREFLQTIPADKWLDLTHTRFIITDKTGDVWREGAGEMSIFFDRQHPVQLSPGEAHPVSYLPSFAATAVYLLADGAGELLLHTEAGVEIRLQGELLDEGLYRYQLPAETSAAEPFTPTGIGMRAGAQPWWVSALTLVNEEDGTFYSLVPGNYRLAYSGDVKIYENLDPLPRAFLVGEWLGAADTAQSVKMMAAPDFDPRQTAVLIGQDGSATQFEGGEAVISRYSPQQVVIAVQSSTPALLVLLDAAYPGWSVTVDGEPAEIETVNGMFRGLFVPAGRHEVRFDYVGGSWVNGRFITLLGLTLLLLISAVSRRSRQDAALSGVPLTPPEKL